MHMQGGKRREAPVSVGEIVHEKGAPQHEVRVTEAESSHIAVEYLEDGRVGSFGYGEFKERFAYE